MESERFILNSSEEKRMATETIQVDQKMLESGMVGLAKKYGMTLEQIMQYNKGNKTLKLGQNIRVLNRGNSRRGNMGGRGTVSGGGRQNRPDGNLGGNLGGKNNTPLLDGAGGSLSGNETTSAFNQRLPVISSGQQLTAGQQYGGKDNSNPFTKIGNMFGQVANTFGQAALAGYGEFFPGTVRGDSRNGMTGTLRLNERPPQGVIPPDPSTVISPTNRPAAKEPVGHRATKKAGDKAQRDLNVVTTQADADAMLAAFYEAAAPGSTVPPPKNVSYANALALYENDAKLAYNELTALGYRYNPYTMNYYYKGGGYFDTPLDTGEQDPGAEDGGGGSGGGGGYIDYGGGGGGGGSYKIDPRGGFGLVNWRVSTG